MLAWSLYSVSVYWKGGHVGRWKSKSGGLDGAKHGERTKMGAAASMTGKGCFTSTEASLRR